MANILTMIFPIIMSIIYWACALTLNLLIFISAKVIENIDIAKRI